MSGRFLPILLVLAVTSAWSQVSDTTVPGGAANNASAANAEPTPTTDDSRMLTPPPASGQAFPVAPESQARSNYVRAGVTVSSAYSDNVLGGVTANPVSDVSYSVWPTIALDQTTPRLHSTLTYAPGFTYYQRTNGRNEADQNASLDFQYRVTEHVSASFEDSFQKTSNVFNQPDLGSAGAVFGSTQAPTAAVIAPIANRLSNNANAELTYQYSASSMIGAGGAFTNLHYPDPTQVPGLFDSSSRAGSGFYTHRLSKKHYVGALYQYSQILAYPVGPQFETQTHAAYLFYTVYVKPTLSLSFSGGPQHYEALQGPIIFAKSWSPAGIGSFGWQGKRMTFATSYSRMVTGGGGLIGAFHSNSATVSLRWLITRNWSLGEGDSYSVYRNVSMLFPSANPGGHGVSGTISVQRLMGSFVAEAGYTRLHQSYSRIAVIATAPDTNREYLSISYRFTHPIGR